MALLDFLKNKKEKDKAKEKKADKVLVASKMQTGVDAAPAYADNAGKKTGKFSYTIIREPHISEKATDLAEKNKYTFKVYANSNKPEIKKSVEGIYGVNVLDVNIIKAPRKKRRLGRTEGFKKAFIKAVVTIKEGQKIEIF